MKLFVHVCVLAVEFAILISLAGFGLYKVLPVQSWAYSNKPQIFEYTFAKGQDEFLKKIGRSRVYYSTTEIPKLCEQQAFDDANHQFEVNKIHRLELPAKVTGFRLDFYPKMKDDRFEESPTLLNVSFDGAEVPEEQLQKFWEARLGFSGYSYKVQLFMNGWWRVLIPVGVVIWLAVIAGAWIYLCQQEGHK